MKTKYVSVEIDKFTTLNNLIKTLIQVQRNIPSRGDADIQVKGDPNFGYKIAVNYSRDMTEEEIREEEIIRQRYQESLEAAERAKYLELHQKYGKTLVDGHE